MNSNNDRAGARDDVRARTGQSNVGAGRLAQQIEHQRIAGRAYEIYESRYRTDGHADDDWLQAEAEYVAWRANHLAAARDTAPDTRTATTGHK
jgi:hypothetical protein